jgi:hypothetical protein
LNLVYPEPPHPKSLSLWERDFEKSLSGSPLPRGEGLGVRAKTVLIQRRLGNVD